MKPKILKLSLFCLVFALMGASCQDDDDLFEIQIGDENAVIEKTVDGIEFKFCLLNEQGEPATVFNEGENFAFQFTILNKTGESLMFHNYSFYEDDDFFSVYNHSQNFGKPFELITGLPTATVMRYIHDNVSIGITSPWQDDRNSFSAMYGSFKGLNKEKLNNGKYITSFTHNFHFGEINTGRLTFKINFEIK